MLLVGVDVFDRKLDFLSQQQQQQLAMAMAYYSGREKCDARLFSSMSFK